MIRRERTLFGASGQIGAAILRRLGVENARTFSWAEIQGFSDAELKGVLREQAATDFIFANGQTDPRLPIESLVASNVGFPRRVIDLSGGLLPGSSHRYLTLGSIQENFPEVCQANPYLRSKILLAEAMASAHDAGSRAGRFLHVRVHTIYGDRPKGHMFLGQMAAAIGEKKVFEMSSGDQLREYHHRDDLAEAIVNILDREWLSGPVLEVNSGEPVRLADLAQAVFKAFEVSGLLRIGAISRSPAENTNRRFERSPAWLLSRSREPIAGVIDSLREFL